MITQSPTPINSPCYTVSQRLALTIYIQYCVCKQICSILLWRTDQATIC